MFKEGKEAKPAFVSVYGVSSRELQEPEVWREPENIGET